MRKRLKIRMDQLEDEKALVNSAISKQDLERWLKNYKNEDKFMFLRTITSEEKKLLKKYQKQITKLIQEKIDEQIFENIYRDLNINLEINKVVFGSII